MYVILIYSCYVKITIRIGAGLQIVNPKLFVEHDLAFCTFAKQGFQLHFLNSGSMKIHFIIRHWFD